MKKNKMMRIASVLLVAVLLSTCVISGTFAKYTTEVTGSDSAKVAKWEFTIGDDAINATTVDSFTFDLFETINDTGNEEAETDVDEGLIAPGTSGSFDIVLTNLSEVTANYAIAFTATLADVPLQFKTTGDWTTDITTLDISASNDTELDMTDGTATVTVYWQWIFENDVDAADTALGFAAITSAAEPTVTATVTFTQVD